MRIMVKRAAEFDVHPSVELMQTWITSLPQKTGRSLEQWMEFINRAGPKGEPAARTWLKDNHGLGTNAAWWLAERAYATDLSRMDDDPERYLALAPQYMDGQYAGKKEGLRPIFTRVATAARKLGKDVKVCPCKTMTPLYRRHVFAEVKPTTNSRVDLGLALGSYTKKLPARLIDTGGAAKKNRITHRIPLARPEDFDADAAAWLGRAYELDA